LSSIRTLAGEGRSQNLIKGSRFCGLAAPIEAPEELARLIDRARADWPQANHHAWAYRLTDAAGRILYRSSDDGEPGGTAGRPIYAVLDGGGLTGAGVVVSRVFGGVKLGTGGLVRAYGGAARDAVEDAGIVERAIVKAYTIECPVEQLGMIEAGLHRRGWAVQERRVEGASAAFVISMPAEEAEALGAWLSEATSGRGRLAPVEDQEDPPS
jgi:uncharacterized YigZ family protein